MAGIKAEKLAGFMSATEAQKLLKTSRQNIHKWMEAGKFAEVRFVDGGEGTRPIYLIPSAEVERLAREREAASARAQEHLDSAPDEAA